MAATHEDIKDWVLEAAKNKKNSHLLVVCDTFDYDDYPVEIKEGEDINAAIKKYSENMQRVMEVYSMKLPLQKQLDEHRAWHPEHK